MLLHAYNDLYYRVEPKLPPDKEQYFMSTNMERLLEIINWDSKNMLFKAELYREMSDFDKCIQVLSAISYEEFFMEESRKKIIAKAQQKNNVVFSLTPPAHNIKRESFMISNHCWALIPS